MPSTALALCSLRLRLNRSFLGFQLAVDLLVPVGYVLLAAASTPAADHNRLATGAFLVGAMLSIMRLPAFVIMNEKAGVRNLLVSAGVTSRDYLLANIIGTGYFLVFPAAALLLASLVLKSPVPATGAYWLVLLVYVVFLHGCGLILASLFRAFPPFVLTTNLVILGTTALCPIFYPASHVPPALGPVVDLLPGSLAAALAFGATRTGAVDTGDISILAACSALAVAIGYGLALRPSRE